MRSATTIVITGVCLLGVLVMPGPATGQTATQFGTTPQSQTVTTPASRWYVSPFIGATGGADAAATGTTTGVSVGWKGAGWWGVEAELAGTPFFFEQTSFLTDRSVRSVSGNLVVALPMGENRVQPYVTGGFGAVWSKLGEAGGLNAVESTQPAVNIGGGLTARLRDQLGVRGDFRYSRNLGNADDDVNLFGVEFSKLGYWRVAGGLVLWF